MTTCSRCGEDVRWGWRPSLTSPQGEGKGFWMHRDRDDHPVILGIIQTEADRATIELALDEPRLDADGEVYTTREYDIARMTKAQREARADEDDDQEVYEHEIPPPEVTSTPIDIGDDRLPGGAKQILVLARKHGWTAWATYSRGPRLHASQGHVLSMSDFVVVRLRLDGSLERAVASWVDEKFSSAWRAPFNFDKNKYVLTPANFMALKAYIKHEEDE